MTTLVTVIVGAEALRGFAGWLSFCLTADKREIFSNEPRRGCFRICRSGYLYKGIWFVLKAGELLRLKLIKTLGGRDRF